MSFLSWLDSQKDRQDPVGDLSRDSLDDKRHRPRQGTERMWLAYLDLAGACPGAIEACKDAWLEYRHEYEIISYCQATKQDKECAVYIVKYCVKLVWGDKLVKEIEILGDKLILDMHEWRKSVCKKRDIPIKETSLVLTEMDSYAAIFG